MKGKRRMAAWIMIMILLMIFCVPASAQQASKDGVWSELGALDFGKFRNVSKVDISRSGSYQNVDVYFKPDVYYAGSDGYLDEWMTATGIAADMEIDLDKDGVGEYLVVYAAEAWGNKVWNDFRIAIFEPQDGKYVKAADFESSFSAYGFGEKRYVRILETDDKVFIITGSDASNSFVNLFSYDGRDAYIELMMCISPYAFNNESDYEYGYSYALKEKIPAEKFSALEPACFDTGYDRSKLERLVHLTDDNFVSSKTGAVGRYIQMAQELGVSIEVYNDRVSIKDSVAVAESAEADIGRDNGNKMRFYTSRVGTPQNNDASDQQADAQENAARTGTVYVYNDSNLRSGPGLSYSTVSSVAGGKTMVWLGETAVDERGVLWYKVQRKNGEEAWISSRYSQLETDDGAPIEIPFGKLMKGNKGEKVVELQQMLARLGYHSGSCDGDYGNQTVKSVKAFQQAAGLPITGEVDEETWNAILEALKPEEEEEILEILSPDNGDVVALFDGEDIVITWTACKDADYYMVTVTDEALTQKAADRINAMIASAGVNGAGPSIPDSVQDGKISIAKSREGDSWEIYSERVDAGKTLSVTVSMKDLRKYYTGEEEHTLKIAVKAYSE